MSKGPWIRDPLTGLSASGSRREEDLFEDRDLRRSYPDCNLFDVSSIAAAAGYKSLYYFTAQIMENPVFHTHKIKDSRGRTFIWGTHQNSAEAGGAMIRSRAAEVHKQNLKQFRTDVSSRRTVVSE